MGNAVRISDAEWDVMEVVWSLGSATAAQVIEELAATKDWNHRTIRTMLARLLEKGALRREGTGQRSVYRAAVSRQQCVRAESRSFVEKMFSGDVASLVVHFVRESKLDEEDIQRLKQILDEKTRET